MRGVLIELQRAGVALAGPDLRVTPRCRSGAGLSSSASFEVAVALAMLERCRRDDGSRSTSRSWRSAPRCDHTGTRSGIMDQFAVLFGEAGIRDVSRYALARLRARAGAGRGARSSICNTMVKHALAAGAYNERRDAMRGRGRSAASAGIRTSARCATFRSSSSRRTPPASRRSLPSRAARRRRERARAGSEGRLRTAATRPLSGA